MTRKAGTLGITHFVTHRDKWCCRSAWLDKSPETSFLKLHALEIDHEIISTEKMILLSHFLLCININAWSPSVNDTSYYWSNKGRQYVCDRQNNTPPKRPIISGKEPTCQCKRHKRLRFESGLGRSLGGGHGNPLQYSCLENTMDKGAWWATVHRMSKSQTQLKRVSTHAKRPTS